MISQNAASAPVRPATECLLLTCPLQSNLRHNHPGHCPHQTHSTVTYYLLPTCPLHGNLRHRSATTLAPVRPAARQQNICMPATWQLSASISQNAITVSPTAQQQNIPYRRAGYTTTNSGRERRWWRQLFSGDLGNHQHMAAIVHTFPFN